MPASTDRTFGIELEVAANMTETFEALRAANINVQMESYNHSARAHWKVVSDASVPGGAEVVSPVLSGEEGIAEAVRVAQALTAGRIRVNRQCGFHVHVGADDLSADHVKLLIKRYAAHEATIDAFMPESRRGSSNMYCRPMADHARRVDMLSGSARMVAQALSDRYRKLNVQSLWRQGTVEFRQHSGTVDPAKIEKWVRFCIAFVEATKAAADGGAAAAVSGYTPNSDYIRATNRNWGNIIEQIEAAGGQMELTAPRARTYRISGPAGQTTATVAQLLALYVSPRSADLHPIRFARWWADTVAPVLAAPTGTTADDSVFAGMQPEVADFFRTRAAAFRAGATR